ncbi:MAG: hypothetical protein UIH41_07400 [Treponemataceae bacterium]|nr:hypothetical protein [Treponemataceae bacterium]
MIYKYYSKASKKSWQLYALVAGCVIAGIVSCFIFSYLAGIALFTAAIYILIIIRKNMKKIKAARLSTTDEGFTAYKTDGSYTQFTWEEITSIFKTTNDERKNFLWVYNKNEDKSLRLPPLFENFQDFEEELREHHEIIETDKMPWDYEKTL